MPRRGKEAMTLSTAVFTLAFMPLTRLWMSRAIVGRCRSPAAAPAGRFTRTDAGVLWKEAWRAFAARSGNLPEEPTLGSRLVVRYACWSLALLRALVSRGIDRARAVELVSDVTWLIYVKWGVLLRFRRGRGLTDGFGALPYGAIVPLRFPFNPPGFIAIWRPTDIGVRYDMVRCPLAEYFRQQSAVDLCVVSACGLDFALVQQQGRTLKRDQTPVEGHEHCTFWWTPRRTNGPDLK